MPFCYRRRRSLIFIAQHATQDLARAELLTLRIQMDRLLERLPIFVIVSGGLAIFVAVMDGYLGLGVCGALLIAWGIALNLARCGESRLAIALTLVSTILIVAIAMIAYLVPDVETAWTLS
ncbi:MAG: hypothetical protein QG625_2497 [Cyanobacteriota bacterium erpe_2018_sw_39hr_WHONDRS-SW48-000098_B_bin.30]|jgi:uncharacterized iron-regulated membrane protein|nr:hypothetical protein [Cyanobacteriota bacterium erpe_2018_sw_39hr_WHONDRS-SW48-000098_B_bin.30]